MVFGWEFYVTRSSRIIGTSGLTTVCCQGATLLVGRVLCSLRARVVTGLITIAPNIIFTILFQKPISGINFDNQGVISILG